MYFLLSFNVPFTHGLRSVNFVKFPPNEAGWGIERGGNETALCLGRYAILFI